MSEQEIIQKTQNLVEMLGRLRDYACNLTSATGRELDTQLLTSYTTRIGHVLSEIQDIRERLRSTERDLTRRESELDGRDVELQELRKKAEDLELELSSANSAVQKLEDQRAAGDRDRITLVGSLQTATERVAHVVSRELEIASRERAADEALRKNEELVASNTAHEDRLAQRTQEVTRAQEACRSAEATLQRGQQALENGRAELEAAKGRFEQDRAGLDEMLSSVRTERTRLQESLDRVKKQENDARALRAEAEEEKRLSEAAKAEADSLKAEANSTKAEADSLKAEADSAKAVADSLKAEANSTKAEADSLRAEADLALHKAQTKESAAEQLESESASRLVIADQKLDDILEGLENLKSIHASCEKQDAEAGRNVTATASSLQKANELAARLEQDRAEVAGHAAKSKTELAEILNQLRATQREGSANLASSVSINQQAKDILEGTNQSVRERIQSAEQSRDSFKTQAEQLDRQWKAARTTGALHRDNLDRKTTAFERDVRDLITSRDSLQTTVDRQTGDLRSQQGELRSQQSELIHLKRDRDELERQVRRAESAAEDAEESVDSLDAEARTLRYRSKAAEDKVAELQKTVGELRARASVAEKKREASLDQGLQSLTKSYKELQVEATARASVQSLEEKVAGLERELQDSREECKRARTERGNRELESRQSGRSELGQPRAEPSAMSKWEAAVEGMLQYLKTFRASCPERPSPGFLRVDEQRLMRAFGFFLATDEKRDRFTAFLEAGCSPDSWHCLEQICSSQHGGIKPLEGRCPIHHAHNDCSLQVRHVDASSGGRTLECRAPVPGDIDEGEEDEDEDGEDGGVLLATDTS